jgi:hypothetical protein
MSKNHKSKNHKSEIIPEEHLDLHQFLYSSEGVHEVETVSILENQVDTGENFVDLKTWEEHCQGREQKDKLAVVFAIADAGQASTLQYIGDARATFQELRTFLDLGYRFNQIRVQTFKFPKREQMEQLRDRWIPIRNQLGSEWNLAKLGKSLTPQEELAHIEKKLKLQTAMAIATEMNAPEDWSSLIANQTSETLTKTASENLG